MGCMILNIIAIFHNCIFRDGGVNTKFLFLESKLVSYSTSIPNLLKLVTQGLIIFFLLLDSNKLCTKVYKINSIMMFWVPYNRSVTKKTVNTECDLLVTKFSEWMERTNKLTETPFPLVLEAIVVIASFD